MNYKPPVKSSVKKLHDRRFPSDQNGSSHRSSSTGKSAYASAYSLSSSSSQTPSQSFERRMRDLVLGSPQTHRTSTPVREGLPPNLHVIEDLQDYKKVVGDEEEKIVAVRFYATYCRACKAVAPLFYQTAAKFPNVVFVDVPVSQKNAALHQGLGVQSLPFAHIYHPDGGLVEELKLTRNHISEFRSKLDRLVKGFCDLDDEISSE